MVKSRIHRSTRLRISTYSVSVIRDVLSAIVAEFGTTVAHLRRDVGKRR